MSLTRRPAFSTAQHRSAAHPASPRRSAAALRRSAAARRRPAAPRRSVRPVRPALLSGCLSLLAVLLAGFFTVAPPVFADPPASDNSADSANADSANPKPAVWIQLSPTSNRLVISGGKVYDCDLNIQNLGTKSFNFRLYATPYSAADSNYNLDYSTETNYTQIARWVTFEDADGNYTTETTRHLEPNGQVTVKYRVTVPESIPDGGQYATIFAEALNDGPQKASGVKTVSRVGLILYAQSTGHTEQLAEIPPSVITTFLLDGPIRSSTIVKNLGNTDITASSTLTVKTLFGKTLFEDRNNSFVLPESERHIDFEWKETPPLGLFQASLRTTAADQVEEKTLIVMVLPMGVLIIALLLLTILVIWIIVFIRKRRERKSRLLS